MVISIITGLWFEGSVRGPNIFQLENPAALRQRGIPSTTALLYGYML
ncbi:MAG: hypothetical protein ACXWCG_07515 [Flavitalea sp.]